MTNTSLNPIYVVGHKNPDTDAIVSAIGYAELKRRTGTPTAQAAALGEPWVETRYLLERFGVPAPPVLRDVYRRARDVMNPGPQYLQTTTTMREAGPVMRHKRIVPVVDGDHRFVGAVTLDDVAARYLEEMDLAGGIQSRISYESLVRTLDGELLAGDAGGDWQGRVFVAAMRAESIAGLVQPGDLVVLGDRTDAQRTSIEAGAGCLVIVRSIRPEQEILALAAERGIRLIVTPHDSYRITRLLNLSIPVSEVMRREVPLIEVDDLASEASETLTSSRISALPVVDGDHRLVGILDRSDLLRARGKGIILVDHNHSTQAVEGLEQAQLLEVIDHHNLGDLHTPEPIYMKLEPVGSTSTIVAELYQDAGEKPDPSTAVLLAGGIVSDTLLFRSLTCADRDRAAGEWLASIANVNLEELAQGMFRANSNYGNTTPAKILESNLKVFEWGGKRVGIGQAETVDIGYFRDHQDEFRTEMRRLKLEQGWDYVFFLATDILSQSSTMVLADDEERALAERAFRAAPRDGSVELPGVVSPKKQVVARPARELS